MKSNKGGIYFFFKRFFDLSAAVILGLLLLPFMLAVCLVIVIDSRGGAVYRQERLGKGGKPFMMLKFRTMLLEAEAEGPRLAEENDERCTKVGKFLRKSRIDELPQLWNIICGDMSFVGPRPERAYFYREYENTVPGFSKRLAVRPGLTGLAQVKGLGLEPEEKLKYDLIYIENRCIGRDLLLILQTPFALIKKQRPKCEKCFYPPISPAPRVSVILPVYNGEKHLMQAALSVLGQDIDSLELLIADDGSRDGSADTARLLQNEDGRVGIITHSVNCGTAEARNSAVKHARGEYIAFIDCDDIWLEGKLSCQMSLMERGCLICCTGYCRADKDGKPTAREYPARASVTLEDLLKNNSVGCSTVMIKKALLDKYLFDPEYYHEDYHLWLRLASDGYEINGIEKTYVLCKRVRGAKTSSHVRSAVHRYKIYRRAMKIPFFKSLSYMLSYLSSGIGKHYG